MLIQSRLRRVKRHLDDERIARNVGTKIELFGVEYFFHAHPELTGSAEDHVALVLDTAAVERLLAMPEYFNEYGRDPAANAQLIEHVVNGSGRSDKAEHEDWLDAMVAQPVAVFSNETRFVAGH
jgi:hypothetical protein